MNADSPHFIKTPDELHVLPGVPEAVAALNTAGFLTVIISNQSGIARGLVTEESLAAMNAKLVAAVEGGGGRIAGIYFCPHLPGGECECRKPRPGMVRQAAREHAIDLSASYLVGDKPDDIACGAAAGCRTVLVLSGQTTAYDASRFTTPPDHICANLPEAAGWILADTASPR